MHTTTEADLSPAERSFDEAQDFQRSELATILAAGFLRLRARVRVREEGVAEREISPPEKPPKSSRI